MYNGIINVYKEKGYTSHDVVAKLRGILKQKKIGHTGTLDPDATGVLPVCLGIGTKLCDMLTDRSKTYKAVLLLGVTTDTEDITGEIICKNTVNTTEDEVVKSINSFIGEYDQIPPMYSAIKVNGKKLYELAREGKSVERKPRHVVISDIEITGIDLPYVTMTVSCEKGTYIRSLCRDIGEKLGCGGCVESLVRTRVGNFTIDKALTLKQIEELRDAGKLSERIETVDSVFLDYPKILVKGREDTLVSNGNKFPKKEEWPDGFVRVYRESTGGCFAGVYVSDNERFYKPYKMFQNGE